MKSLAFALTVSCGLVAAPVSAPLPSFQGCVVKEGPISPALLKGMAKTRRLVKLAHPDGSYRCTLEVEGYPLKELLDRAQVKKKVDDGFNRPLDTFVLVKGAEGKPALLSWSEISYAGDGGPLLVDLARFIKPGHHKTVPAIKPDPTTFLSPSQRSSLNFKTCSECHDGKEKFVLSMPKGWLLVVPNDAFGGRFVENVRELSVQQVGIPVKANKEAAKTVIVDVPDLVALDGRRTPLTAEGFAKAPKVEWKDATFGQGRGFHGMRHWEGTDLAALLRPMLPPGEDPAKFWVLVTAEDGYRALYSGAEVFQAPEGRGILLIDHINGKPLEAGTGRYHTVPKADFFIDRDVRQVKEIRLGRISEP